tara:strand:+ start:8071 stop:11151 length:3081 start_codon:yes stop_codon:yes gene_type:complete
MALIYEIINNTISVDRPIQFRIKEEDGSDMRFTTEGSVFINYMNTLPENVDGNNLNSYVLKMGDIRGSLGFYNGFSNWEGLAQDIPTDGVYDGVYPYLSSEISGAGDFNPHMTDMGDYVSFRNTTQMDFMKYYLPYAFSIGVDYLVLPEWETENFSAIVTIPSLIQVAPEYVTSQGVLAGVGIYDNGNPYINCNGIGLTVDYDDYESQEDIANLDPFATIANYNNSDLIDAPEHGSVNFEAVYGAMSNEWFSQNQTQLSRVDGQNIQLGQQNIPIDVESLIGTQILFNSRFNLSFNTAGGLVQEFSIRPSTEGGYDAFGTWDRYSFSKCTFFVGESSNFGLNIINVNVPQSIPENTTANCSVTIQSQDFSGSAILVMADENGVNDIDLFQEVWGADNVYNEDIIANYGTIEVDSGNPYIVFNIAKQEIIEIPFTYTSNNVSDNQADMFGLFIHTYDLMLSDYENPEDAQSQYQQYSPKYNFVDNLIINIQDEVLVDDESQPSNNIIEKPSDIMYHIAATELGYDKEVDSDSIRESRIEHSDWNMAFSINSKINSKKLFQELSLSSKSYPTFSNDRLKFINLKNQHIGSQQGELISEIKSLDVIDFNINRTRIEDLKTQVEVKYKYDYGKRKFEETTGEIRVNEHYLQNKYFTTGSYQQKIDGTIATDINYYGLKTENNEIDHINTFLIYESKYIRDYNTALNLAQHLLAWRCNQHNLLEVTLPLSYYYLELGDLVEFDEMILNKKLYGEPYVLETPEDMPIRGGQLILPHFMIHKIRKGINSIKVDLIQLHHLGFQDLHYNNYVYENAGYFYGLLGDVNNDGTIDVLDVVLIVNHIIHQPLQDSQWELTGGQHYRADINQDGAVTVLDLISVIDYIVNEGDRVENETFNNIKSNPVATKSKLLYEENKVELETNGEIAVIEISYSGKFSGVKKLGKGWTIKTGENKILIYSLGKSEIQKSLFTYTGNIKINYARCYGWDRSLHYAPSRNIKNDGWTSRNTTWETETRKPEEIKANTVNRIIRKSRI